MESNRNGAYHAILQAVLANPKEMPKDLAARSLRERVVIKLKKEIEMYDNEKAKDDAAGGLAALFGHDNENTSVQKNFVKRWLEGKAPIAGEPEILNLVLSRTVEHSSSGPFFSETIRSAHVRARRFQNICFDFTIGDRGLVDGQPESAGTFENAMEFYASEIEPYILQVFFADGREIKDYPPGAEVIHPVFGIADRISGVGCDETGRYYLLSMDDKAKELRGKKYRVEELTPKKE